MQIMFAESANGNIYGKTNYLKIVTIFKCTKKEVNEYTYKVHVIHANKTCSFLKKYRAKPSH